MTDEPQRPSWRVSDLATSLIRTWVPIAAGAVLTWLGAHFNIIISDEVSAGWMPWIVAGVTGGYYWVSRQLERVRGERTWHRAAQWLGRWMLGGIIRQPTYPAATGQLLEIQRDGSMRAVR